MIDSYSFGELVVGDRRYTSDVILTPGGVRNWWRRKGHEVCASDLDEAVASTLPEVVIIGSGRSQMMKVPPETRRWLESRGVKVIVEGTEKACDTYNEVCRSRKAMAALHLTC